MHVFILPTVGVFNGKWRREIAPVRVKVHCKSTQVVIYCSKSVCWNWTESCSVSPREFKAFGVVVRLDHEPILRVCLVSQTMLLSYSTVFEVRTCGWGLVQSTYWTELSVEEKNKHIVALKTSIEWALPCVFWWWCALVCFYHVYHDFLSCTHQRCRHACKG